MNCPRCGAANFRFACRRCSLLTPAACEALLPILETVKGSIVSAAKVRADLERQGTFAVEDVEVILSAIRLNPKPGLSFPLWDYLRALWRSRR
jgi:hypothetical protein